MYNTPKPYNPSPVDVTIDKRKYKIDFGCKNFDKIQDTGNDKRNIKNMDSKNDTFLDHISKKNMRDAIVDLDIKEYDASKYIAFEFMVAEFSSNVFLTIDGFNDAEERKRVADNCDLLNAFAHKLKNDIDNEINFMHNSNNKPEYEQELKATRTKLWGLIKQLKFIKDEVVKAQNEKDFKTAVKKLKR